MWLNGKERTNEATTVPPSDSSRVNANVATDSATTTTDDHGTMEAQVDEAPDV